MRAAYPPAYTTSWQINPMQSFHVEAVHLPPEVEKTRKDIRSFLAYYKDAWAPQKRVNSWSVGDAAFSAALGDAGFIGMVWPKHYGGHEKNALERYVVLEELLAAGAPVGAHWIADRQSGPLLLRYGSEKLRRAYLPDMARGRLYACIGLSEPNAGSDLASVRTHAHCVGESWIINGQKIWTSGAHRAHIMIALVRTQKGSSRNQGLSQVLIPMDTPGVRVRPIIDLAGGHDFNEVFFENVRVPQENLLGVEGEGWAQATAELSLERAGPERYLSAFPLLAELIRHNQTHPHARLTALIGNLSAQLWTLRHMSLSVAVKMNRGEDPAHEAVMVKDLGNKFEQDIPQLIHAILGLDLHGDDALAAMLVQLLQMSPSFSLRGGTREILRGIIARGLGLR